MVVKIQYDNILKRQNIEHRRTELVQRGIVAQVDTKTTWTVMIKLLKENEKDNKYINPLTNYTTFKCTVSHLYADFYVI